jgi:hypothetical protein
MATASCSAPSRDHLALIGQLSVPALHYSHLHKRRRKSTMEQAQLIQAAASIASGMAAAHYDKFAGLVASRITEIAETAVKIAKAIEIEARKSP